MKTHFKIVVLDETEYWCESIKQKAGKIYAAYLFDANRPVNCCELRPSYELYPLYTTPLNDDEAGSVSEEIMASESQDVSYFHCCSIDRLSPASFYDIGVETLSADETWEAALERTLDHYRGNHMIDIPMDTKLAA